MFRVVLYFMALLNCLIFPLCAEEIKSLDGFLLTAYDDKFKIISPEKMKSSIEVTIENKTLVRLIGHLFTSEAPTKLSVSVAPGKFQKYIIKIKNKEKIIFLPLSPAFQEVELIVGHKTYEIPPKK